LDWENLPKYGLETYIFALAGRQILLQKLYIRIELNLDQVWWLYRLLNLPEINAL
jgi:hypothetical protein